MVHVLKPEERKSMKRKYEFASESESENKIPGYDINVKNIEKRQDSFQKSSSRECKAEPGGDEDMGISRASFALAIDDIFKQILISVDRSSLFSCRLVSHRWRTVSTEVLRRQDICINLFVSEDPTAVYPTLRSAYKEGPKKLALSKFMSFLNKTYTPSSSLTLDTFPCNTLRITDCSLNYPELQSLLDVYGEHLRYLYVCSEFTTSSQCESNFIKQVEHLLCVQAPNLQRLTFQELKFKSAISAPTSATGLLKKTASESNTVVKIRKQNPKLRRLTLKPGSRNIIDSIVDMCPNLNQIDVFSSDIHVLIHPTNLFHFARKFVFDCGLKNLRDFQLLEAAILMSPEERRIQNLPPIKCTKLAIDFSTAAEDLNSREDMRLSLVRIINRILESSWETLELIDFSWYTDTMLRGLKWPRVLPKVKHLYSQPNNYGSCGLEIFPLDGSFKIQDTFPRLEDMIFFVSHGNIKNSNAADFSLKRRLGPVPSVTDVEVTVLCKFQRDWNEEEEVDEDKILCFYSKKLLLSLFPSLAVSFKFVYTD